MIDEKKIFVIVDDFTLNGISRGLCEAKERDSKSVILTPSLALRDYNFKNAQEGCIYMRSPYFPEDSFLDINDKEIEIRLSKEKCIAYREMMYDFGVYSAEITDELHHYSSKDKSIEGNAKHGKLGEANGNIGISKELNTTIKSHIKLDPSKREFRGLSKIKEIASRPGFINDMNIKRWIERWERDGDIKGSESIILSFSGEYKSALDIVANLKIMEAGLGFKLNEKSDNVQSFTRTLKVCWTV